MEEIEHSLLDEDEFQETTVSEKVEITTDSSSHQSITFQSETESGEVIPHGSSTNPDDTDGKKDNSTIPKKKNVSKYRLLNLPLSRVKQIMKMDPDLNLAGSEAVFLVAKAAELFIQAVSKDASNITISNKKKTIQKKDVEAVIQNTDALCFLDGIEL